MTRSNSSELAWLLEQSAREGSQEGREILESALEVLPMEGDVLPNGTPFEVQVLLNSQGTIAVATTRKVPNLRFRLSEVLLEIAGYMIDLPGKLQQPISALLSTLSFLRNLNKLATITIESSDAELLIAIFRLTRDREVLDLDALSAATLEIPEPRRTIALERLEQLACITLAEGTVQMNETIIVERK